MNNVIIETFSALFCEMNFERGAVRGPDEMSINSAAVKKTA